MYNNFTHNERVKLALLLRQGKSVKEIADTLNRARSTIYRELEKGKTDKYKQQYSVRAAEAETKRRRVKAHKQRVKLEPDTKLAEIIEEKLKSYWSPQQIEGRLRRQGKKSVCFKTIYNYMYEKKPKLKQYLRQQDKANYGTKKRQKKRRRSKKDRINERPSLVDKRLRIGDWEGDTIVGGSRKVSILTHIERKSRYIVADKLDRATKKLVKEKAIGRFQEIGKERVKTITYDNGREFEGHELIGKALDARIYFCRPYSSWERGGCENANGLLRQFYPKGSSFKEISQKDIEKKLKLINNRPRKCLNYRTPREVFFKKV